jgi:hypothetical protein
MEVHEAQHMPTNVVLGCENIEGHHQCHVNIVATETLLGELNHVSGGRVVVPITQY